MTACEITSKTGCSTTKPTPKDLGARKPYLGGEVSAGHDCHGLLVELALPVCTFEGRQVSARQQLGQAAGALNPMYLLPAPCDAACGEVTLGSQPMHSSYRNIYL